MALCGFLRQSTADDVLIGPFVNSTDGATPETGLTIDVEVSKNGQALAEKSDVTAPAHDGGQEVDGYYNCELDATDTNTCGILTLVCFATGALSVRHDYMVVEEAIYDAFFAASANAFSGAAGSTTLTALAAGSITATVIATGAIDADAIADNAIDAGAIAADAITAAKIANGAIDAATFAADVDAEILSYLVDDATKIDASALNTASVTTIPAILTDTAEIGAAGAGLTEAGGTGDQFTAIVWNANWDAEVQSEVADALAVYDPPTKAELDTAVANVSVDEIQASALADLFNTDTGTTYASAVAGSVVAEIADNAGGSALTEAGIADAVWNEAQADHTTGGSFGEIAIEIAEILVDTGTTLDGKIDTVDTVADGIKTKTDSLNFGVAGKVDANVTHMNEAEVTGDGTSGDLWRGA